VDAAVTHPPPRIAPWSALGNVRACAWVFLLLLLVPPVAGAQAIMNDPERQVATAEELKRPPAMQQ